MGEVDAALAQMKALLEAVFQPPYTAHALTVDLVQRDETQDAFATSLDQEYTPSERPHLGQIRIAHAPIGGTVLAYAWTPTQTDPNSAPHPKQSDIVLSSLVDWRKDADVEDGVGGNGGYSIQAVTLHEVLHAIGFGHHALPQSLMFFSASRQTSLHTLFSGSDLRNSAYERAAARGLYTL